MLKADTYIGIIIRVTVRTQTKHCFEVAGWDMNPLLDVVGKPYSEHHDKTSFLFVKFRRW